MKNKEFQLHGVMRALLFLVFLYGVNSVADAQSVKGLVTDQSGEPVIGASISVKGTSARTVTDLDGAFEVNARKGSTIIVSYIGYATEEVKVTGNNLKIKLNEEDKTLDDVVVVGYGTVRKRDLTGSVSSVKSDDIARIPTSNVMEAIQGLVPGLDITKTSGEAGSSVSMLLRGTKSINGSNEPLFIIDGVEGSYEELNTNDIASVEILKDASSTAVYGAAGANGVIIITTKEPKKNKFSIDFDAYYGWNVITSFPDVNRGEAYINFRREAQRAAGLWNGPEDDANLFPSYMQDLIDQGKWVNWFDLASQTGTTSSYNLSTSYSNDRMKSYFSLGYYDMEGLLKGDELKRYSARAKIDFKANDVLKYGLNLYAMYSDNDKRYSRIWNRIICMPPLGEPYNEDGTINNFPLGDNNMTPIADNGEGRYINNVQTLSVAPQIYFELTPLKGLSFKSVLGGYFRNVKQGIYQGPDSYQGLESKAVLASTPNKFTYNYKWQNILTYNLNIKEDHNLTLTGVTEWTKKRLFTSTATANGFDSNDYGYYNLGAATGVPTVSSSYVQSQMMSYVVRANYSYKGRYLLTLSNRWDGSSMLAKGHKWDSFPAAAVAWRISDEVFMEKMQNTISNLKLRLSYGVTGNAGAAEYATMAYSRTGTLGFQDIPQSFSGFSTNIANKDLGWEKSYMFDAGIDLGLLKNRIEMTVDWYRTTTKDILFEMSLPYAAGGYAGSPFTIWSNVGETRNTGVELSITSRNFVGPKFQWTTTLSFAKNNEKVVKTTSDGPLQFDDYYLINGYPVNTYYGYKYAGIWGTAEAEEAAKYGQKPGQVHIAENGEANYVLNADDYYVLGSATPKWSGSLLNTFSYKNFDLSIQLIARWGWTINYGLTGWYRTDGLTPSPTICDYWTPENQNARYPRPDASISNGQDTYQQWANFFDGSYIKVKNISLGYTVPKSLLSKFKVERLRLYFTASNPFIWTKCHYLKNYDPEKGGDDDTAPLSKQFVFGINLSF